MAQQPSSARARRLAAKPWLRRTAIGAVAFLIVLLLFARFAAPAIIRSEGEKLLSANLHRATTIERVEVDPFKLGVAIRGLKIMEPAAPDQAAAVFASFDTLEADLSARSLLRLAPVVEALRLQAPYLHLVRVSPGHYNIDDLIAAAAAPPPAKPPPSDKSPPRFSVYNIQLAAGRIEFDDRPEKTVHTVADLALAVPFISSLASQVEVVVEPALRARIDDAPLELTGKARPYAEPRQATIEIEFGDLDLPRFVEYLPFEPRFKLPSAKFDAHLTATFSQAAGQAPTVLLAGTAALKAVQVTTPAGAPMLSLPRLEVTLDRLDLSGGRLEIAKIALDHPRVDLVREPDGTLSLAQLAPAPSPAPAAPAPPAAAPASAAAPPATTLAIGEVAIASAELHYADHTGPAALSADVERFGLKVSRIEMPLDASRIAVAEIASDSAALHVLQDRPPTAKSSGARPAPAVSPPPAKVAPHRDAAAAATTAPVPAGPIVTVGRLAVADWTAKVEDRTMARPVTTDIAGLRLDVGDFSTAPGHVSQVAFAAAVDRNGRIGIDGKIGLEPLHADLALDIERVDVLPIQPYFTDQVNVLVSRGTASTKGRLALDQAVGGGLRGTFAGEASIAGLATVDKLNAEPLLDWKTLQVSGIRLRLEPFSLAIDQVALNDFFARVIVAPTGRINLQDVLRQGGEQPRSVTAPETTAGAGEARKAQVGRTATATTTATAAPSAPPPPIKVGKVALKGGTVRFTDNFIRPNYNANLADLGGSIVGLSSDPGTRAAVDLAGHVNDAPLAIAGTVNPLKGDLFLDLKASVKGMEMVPFTPYSGRYLGYGIEKGKLSFDVAYKVEDRKLSATNRLVLDQLTFGEKIDSPTATSLPVRLAVSLLQDRNGIIDLDLPIGGSLDDPQFSIGSIIWHAIVNLIEKAVTAPFALLGSLFGGSGEQMSVLAFDPGRATLSAAATGQLESLSKALKERPQLKLEITGHSDPQADREGLRRAGIERKVRGFKLREMIDRGESTDAASVTVAPDEYPALLAKVYKAEKFQKPRNVIGLQKDLPVEEMEKLLMDNAQVSDADLRDLGEQRAQAVANWLEKDGAVAADRIFVVAGAGDNPAARVDFSLK